MEKLVVLMVMFATSCAAPQDLSGKVFIFPKEGIIDRVKLLTSKTTFNAVTTCLRFKTDLSRNYALFSLSTPSVTDAFGLYKMSPENFLHVAVPSSNVNFRSMSFAPNNWHSMCATWRSDNGMAQLWVNGKASIKRFIQSRAITGAPIALLGQEQDNYGGGFDATQSFVGMITNVHMWDHVVRPVEIKRYMDDKHFTPGNVFNWKALDYEVTGGVLVEEESEVM